MPFRLVLFLALGAVFLMTQEQKQVASCCASESARLSQAQVKALVKRQEPIDAPCCGEMLHITGTIALEISVDTDGDVTCARAVSGHPLIIAVVIESVRKWKFHPYASNGKKDFCGQLALRFKASEYGVKYKIA